MTKVAQVTELPVRTYRCLCCGYEAELRAIAVEPHVITFATPLCATCPGHPRMSPIGVRG